MMNISIKSKTDRAYNFSGDKYLRILSSFLSISVSIATNNKSTASRAIYACSPFSYMENVLI